MATEDEPANSEKSESPCGGGSASGDEDGSNSNAISDDDDEAEGVNKKLQVNASTFEEAVPASLKLAQISEEHGGKNLIICAIMGERSDEVQAVCTLLVVCIIAVAKCMFVCGCCLISVDTSEVKWSGHKKVSIAGKISLRPDGPCCLTCSHALEAFCGPEDPPQDQLIKLWKSKDPEWVHKIKVAVMAARAVVLNLLRQEEVIQEEQIKLSLQFRGRFVTELVFKKKFECNADETGMTVFELPGFAGKPLSGVIFKVTKPWPKDLPYFDCLVESSQARLHHAIILPRDRVLTPEHASKRFQLAVKNFGRDRVKQLHDADAMQNLQTIADVWKLSRQVQKNKEQQMHDHLQQNQDAEDGERVAVSTLDDSGGFGMRAKKDGGKKQGGTPGKGQKRGKLNLQFNSPQRRKTRLGLGSPSVVSTVAGVGAGSVASLTQVGAPSSAVSRASDGGSDVADTPTKAQESLQSNSSKRSASFAGGASVAGSVIGLDSFGSGDCQYVVPQEVLDFQGDILQHPTIILKGFPPLRQVRKVMGPVRVVEREREKEFRYVRCLYTMCRRHIFCNCENASLKLPRRS